MSRIDGRKNDELRPIEIIPNINKFAEGSCLIRCGNTAMSPRERAGALLSTPCCPGPTGSAPAGISPS